jgi:hypothetical protein
VTFLLFFSLISTFCLDIHSHILEALNIEWLKVNSLHLRLYVFRQFRRFTKTYKIIHDLRTEVSLRFGGNIVLEDGTTTLALRDFIKYYSAPGRQLLASSGIPQQHKHLVKAQKMPIVMLEGFIHIELVRWASTVHDFEFC